MKAFKEWLQLVIPIALLCVIWYFLQGLNKQITGIREYWENPTFKTDTVHVEVDYSKIPTPTFSFNVPPKQVLTYKDTTITKVSLNLNDSLVQVIDSLKNRITTIHAYYLKLYPEASKLIYAEFHRDSLRFDLLSIDGRIRTLKYGVNYGRFKYQWKDNSFHADPVSRKGAPVVQGYGSIGYDLAYKSPYIGLDYSVYRDSWRLKANTFITIDKNPTYSLQVGIGKRLW